MTDRKVRTTVRLSASTLNRLRREAERRLLHPDLLLEAALSDYLSWWEAQDVQPFRRPPEPS